MKVVLQPHNPSWEIEFFRVRDELLSIFAHIPIISIEHVGSTSIPGLAAKPVLDIDIIVPPAILSSACEAMVSSGYLALGELGIPDRFAFRQPVYGRPEQSPVLTEDGKEMKRNTYVVLEGSLSLRNHLDLKKILKEDADLRNEYGDVKKSLAAQLDHIDDYVRGKNDIVLKILKRAGWKDDELEAVRATNS